MGDLLNARREEVILHLGVAWHHLRITAFAGQCVVRRVGLVDLPVPIRINPEFAEWVLISVTGDDESTTRSNQLTRRGVPHPAEYCRPRQLWRGAVTFFRRHTMSTPLRRVKKAPDMISSPPSAAGLSTTLVITGEC